MIYKKSYTGMFLFVFGLYFISLLIGLSILYFIEVGNSPIYNFLIAAAAMIGIVLLVGIIIDFILSIFSKLISFSFFTSYVAKGFFST